jgi:hypothetical protein
MTNINLRPDAATGTTTANQEKYDKTANSQKFETREAEMEAYWDEKFLEFFSDEKYFTYCYIIMLASVNNLTKGLIDAYILEARALFIKKIDLAKRYMRVYETMMRHEEMQSDECKRTFIRTTELLVYDIMWLDVCSDNKELLGSTGYDTLKAEVEMLIMEYIDVVLNYPDVARVILEWIDRTYGTNLLVDLKG